MHLIVMTGFEDKRASAVIEAYEPTWLSVGIGTGDSPVSQAHHDLNLKFCRRVVSQYENASEFEFSVEDPIETSRAMLRLASAHHPNSNVVIAPLNNKVSTVGAAIAAFKNEDIQLCYGRAAQYNTQNYSEPADYCLSFDIGVERV